MTRRFEFKIALLATALALTGCLENNGVTKFGSSSGLTGTGTSGNQTSSSKALVIANVSIVAGSGSSNSTFTTNVYFDTAKSTSQINSFCSANSNGGPSSTNCVCNFNWTDQNTTTGTAIPIQRGVQTPVSTVQSALVTCPAPTIYGTSILNGTVIQVSVVPGPGNGASFPMTPFPFTKTTSSSSASFQDAQGNSYQDILRYSCYEQYQRGMSIQSQLQPLPNPSTGLLVNVPLATAFCVQSANGQNSTSQNCPNLPPLDYTAQAYYYNLYIRDSEQGDINLANLRYHCPLVKEALGNNGSVGTQNKVWPLDRTFALSLSPTTTFTVGVEGYSKLADGSTDPTAQSSSCYPSASPTPTSGSGSGSGSTGGSTLINSCLGFAAVPNGDGSCPYFRDSNNNIRFTYRLRRYYAIYPPIFDTNGTALNQTQASDTIYVLDRPVTGPNPLQPYTMYGPKPCPFSFYDHVGVTGITDENYPATNNFRPAYVSTNNASWKGKNIDGIQLPNIDSVNSCSAIIGIPSTDRSLYSLGTVNALNLAYPSIYIRPVTPWAPHYVEDKSFLACAPQSSSIQDPPLHFAKDPITNNVGWCAEAYPSQNPNIGNVDPFNGSLGAPFPAGTTYAGDVTPFTSHVVKNASSAACADTQPTLPTNYPSAATCAVNAGSAFTGTLTNGTNAVTAVSSFTGLAVNQLITGAGVPANTFIGSINLGASTLTLSNAATASGATPLRVTNICGAVHATTQYPADCIRTFSCIGTSCTSGSCTGASFSAKVTCDRTVNSQPQDWMRFPLLANAADTETALIQDISDYGCLVSYDNGGLKTGKNSPTGGCCAAPSVSVATGPGGNTAAHLEPTVSCLTPNY